MKLLVAVKEVPDPAAPVWLGRQGEVATGDAGGVLNPLDEIALEAARQWREAGWAREVVAVTVGPASWEGTLRTALAMGADRGVLVETPAGVLPLAVARCLRAVVARERPDLVITGRQGVDGDWAQTGVMLAGMLGWAQAPFVASLALVGSEVHVTREVDGGLERVVFSPPAVITVDLRLNQPRYASLPAILAARRKSVERLVLPVDLSSGVTVLGHELPRQRPAGLRVTSAAELMACLRQRGVVW